MDEIRSAGKVLHILHGLGTGGAETWLLEVVRYLHAHPELGLQIDFLLTGGEKTVLDEEAIKSGARVFYIKYSFGNLLSFRRAFLELLRTERYDALHNHQDFISGWHFLLGAGALPPTRIAHLHNPYNFVRNYIDNPLRWFSFRTGRLLMALLATKITGTSNSVMDEYGYDRWPFRSKRVSPAYCGFNMKAFVYDPAARRDFFAEMRWDAGARVALFVGRIGLENLDTARNQKNPELAFALAKHLVTQDKNWKFLFVGFKGALGLQMEEEVKTLQLQDRIYFTGLRRDIPVLMSAADVLVFPSIWEGLGMVAVEAQANGLPVLASNTVPREAVIIPALVKMLSLEQPLAEWYDAIRKMPVEESSRTDYVELAARAPFSIESSVQYLANLYGSADRLCHGADRSQLSNCR
jgi:glycosyltransferase EpsF